MRNLDFSTSMLHLSFQAIDPSYESSALASQDPLECSKTNSPRRVCPGFLMTSNEIPWVFLTQMMIAAEWKLKGATKMEIPRARIPFSPKEN